MIASSAYINNVGINGRAMSVFGYTRSLMHFVNGGITKICPIVIVTLPWHIVAQ